MHQAAARHEERLITPARFWAVPQWVSELALVMSTLTCDMAPKAAGQAATQSRHVLCSKHCIFSEIQIQACVSTVAEGPRDALYSVGERVAAASNSGSCCLRASHGCILLLIDLMLPVRLACSGCTDQKMT